MTTEVSSQPAGQQVTASEQAIPQGGAQPEPVHQEPKPITREEVEAIALRTAQSLTDKASHKINNDLKNLRTVIDTQRAAGIQITPEQQQAAEAKVIQQAMTAQPEVVATTPEPVGKPETSSPVDPMKYLADQQTAAGITIDPGDPEAAILKGSQGPFDWGLKVNEAISKKQARISTQTDQAAARIPSGGGELPGNLPAASAKQYWEKAHQK